MKLSTICYPFLCSNFTYLLITLLIYNYFVEGWRDISSYWSYRLWTRKWRRRKK